MAGMLTSLAGKPAVWVTVLAGTIAGGLAATGVLPLGPRGAEAPVELAAVPEPEAAPDSTPAPQGTPEAEAAPEEPGPGPEAQTEAPEPKPEPETQAEREPEAPETQPETQPEPQPETDREADPGAQQATAPGFDVVRIEPDGTALIAGTAPAGADVIVSLSEAEVARELAGADGRFVAFLTIPPSDVARVLTLTALLEGQRIPSDAQVVVAATPVAEKAPVVAEADPAPTGAQESPAETQPDQKIAEAAPPQDEAKTVPAQEAAETRLAQDDTAEADPAPETNAPEAPRVAQSPAQPAPQTASATPAQPQAPQAAAPAGDAPTAPTVFLASRDGVRVLQSPRAPERGPEVPTSLALESIAYSDSGDVALAGRGTGGDFVRIYLDNQPVSTSRIAASGAWEVDLPEVDTGIYTLRVDVVDAQGQVEDRVETPFKRESEDVLARAAALAEEADAPITAVTVQPGSTLWAIAQSRYGAGPAYVRVFEANRDLIRDPDLIYPGQVFAIPD